MKVLGAMGISEKSSVPQPGSWSNFITWAYSSPGAPPGLLPEQHQAAAGL